MKLPLLFVYGSLKRGFHNNSVIACGKFLTEFITEPQYTLYDLGAYPAVTLNGHTAIKGEVWEVKDLIRTDYLEGYPQYYDRRLIPTSVGEAWLYYLPYPLDYGSSVVKSGEWLR